MSSGNPFRASISTFPPTATSVHQSAAQRPAAPAPQTSFISADHSAAGPEDGRSGFDDAGAPPQRTKKHVRIESSTTFIPPHPDTDDGHDSPQDLRPQRAAPRAEYVDAPPPAQSHSAAASDVFARDPSTPSTADMWSGLRKGTQASYTARSPGNALANPFSRTLATMEPQGGTGESRTATERAAPGNNRASLDVESFKNLLMTGRPGPRPSGQPNQSTPLPSIPSGLQFESSSSTDTSSISRQSFFEPPQELHPESPRTSYEMAESDEHEDMGLVSEVKKGQKKPPPAPKHRHGKLVTPRQPQVVSFDSFTASEPAPSPVSRPRDNSDVSKPLPPTPVVSPQPHHLSTQDATPPRPPPKTHGESGDSLATAEASRPQKKTPPPVPLARRQSQLRTTTTGTRARSSSSLTIESQYSVDTTPPSSAPSNKDPLSTAKSPPPPPRSRHGARLTDLSNSSANSSTAELPQRSTSTRTPAPPPGTTLSHRSTMDSEPSSSPAGPHHPSSPAPTRTAQRAVSADSTTSTMPPPPPPPRRATRSSIDQQRPVISSPSPPTESPRTENTRASSESKRRTSMASESSLRREYAPVDDEKRDDEYAIYSPNEEVGGAVGEGTGNILDDMDRFQRELEALRERCEKAA